MAPPFDLLNYSQNTKARLKRLSCSLQKRTKCSHYDKIKEKGSPTGPLSPQRPVSLPFFSFLLFFSLLSKAVLSNTHLSSPDSGPLSWAAPIFPQGIVHILRKFVPRQGKKGSRLGGSPNSPGNNDHSGKALYFLSFSFMFFHVL